MIYNIEIYFMLFIIYSFLGWAMECTLGIIQKHKFINRGFLIGPYCPIYGFGVISVLLLLTRFANNVPLLFILASVICGTLEYLTSYFMEKIFHARWWDYSQKKFNINGRVCLETLIPFGIISVIVICWLNPCILSKLYDIPQWIITFFVITFLLIYIIDTIVSFNIILKFKNFSKKERDNTEEITKRVKETAENVIQNIKEEFSKKSKLYKRLISAFPNVEQKDYKRKKNIKNK